MPILFCSLEIHLPYAHSLKEKRAVLRKTAERLRNRFNFSISELEYQDLWQRGRLGAVTIGPDRVKLEQVCDSFLRESQRILGGDLVDYKVEIFDHD